MITKEKFIKIMHFIMKNRFKQDVFLNALDVLSENTYNDCFLYAETESLLMELMREALDDKEDWLGFYFYEEASSNKFNDMKNDTDEVFSALYDTILSHYTEEPSEDQLKLFSYDEVNKKWIYNFQE